MTSVLGRWMRRIGVILALMAALVLGLSACNGGQDALTRAPEGALRVATFNVHYILLNRENGPHSLGEWHATKDALDAAFKDLSADIVAFQEMESFSRGSDGSVNLARDFLLERNPGFRAGASGEWRRFPSTQPIFYRAARLEALEQGWFFFSDTPDVIYSRTFNGSYPAFASWVRFLDRETGKEFRLINVHFEYSSRSNRLKSAALVAERIAPWLASGEEVVLTGDLNARAGARTLDTLEKAGLTFWPARGASYHFGRGLNLFGAIDHLAGSEGVSVASRPVALRKRYDGVWPADHYPVVGDILLR